MLYHLLSHLLGRRVADVRGGARPAALPHVAQQVAADGVGQLLVGGGQLPHGEALRAGVVGLLTAPLQGHQQLLQTPGSGQHAVRIRDRWVMINNTQEHTQ